MKVITEDDIRRFIRKSKEEILCFEVSQEMFLTPSAKSFLREKRIPIKEIDLEPIVGKQLCDPQTFPDEADHLKQKLINCVTEMRSGSAASTEQLFEFSLQHELQQLQFIFRELLVLNGVVKENQLFYQAQLKALEMNHFYLDEPNSSLVLSNPTEELLIRKIDLQIEAILLLFIKHYQQYSVQSPDIEQMYARFSSWQSNYERIQLKGGKWL